MAGQIAKLGTSQFHHLVFDPKMYLPSTLLRFTILAIASTHLISAQLVLPQEVQQEFVQENLDQIPVKLDFGWHNPEMDQQSPQTGPPLLSDILGIDRSLSIFAGLGRSLETVVRLCWVCGLTC